MGFDSFGLPAENAAIKTGVHPRPFTDERIEELRSSISRIGAVYDWRREVKSHDPDYIRWTQWIFLRFLEAGLAYRKNAPVNWCPGCQTVLANEQVLADGTCERSGDVVEKRDLEQWFFKITDYADQLLDDLDDLDWPERVKTMQRNWIGRSEGAEFEMAVVRRRRHARPATPVRGVHHPARHQLRHDLRRPGARAPAGRRRSRPTTAGPRSRRSSPGARARSDVDRLSTEGALDKRGVSPAPTLLNPFTEQPVPLYLADYVLMGYGTGAIMAVPGRGPARLGLRQGATTCRSSAPSSRPTAGRARRTPATARPSTASGSTAWTRPTPSPRPSTGSRSRASARRKVNYRLRDWLLSPPAVLGLPDPGRLLRRPRHRAGARRPAAGAGARRRRVPADGRVAAAAPRGLPAHDLPDVRRPGRARDRHHGHVRRLVLVLPALLRPVERRRAVRPRRRPSSGCRSTSTSAASSTPSST